MYQTLLITNEHIAIDDPHIHVINFNDYVSLYPQKNEHKVRIINLCNTSKYLSEGYYCSLLAEARKHKVLPSVSTINDLRKLSKDGSKITDIKIPSDIEKRLLRGESIAFNIYFGYVEDEDYAKLARRIFDQYPTPILGVSMKQGKHGFEMKVMRQSYEMLSVKEKQKCLTQLTYFTKKVWRQPASQKKYRWDLAILVNPDEPQPPSDQGALKRFIQAAAKVGIHAECVTASQLHHISQYDALFIRETTAIDHHTYALARKAEKEGVVVIDDSNSILRCCNKVFLHDAFSYNKVPSLKTHVVYDATEETLDKIESMFNYPVVLKMPEGSFSKGVFKRQNRSELALCLKEMLQDTALVLIQEYLYTAFDWRIGVLNGRPIYACKYHMVPNHWQIYSHKNKRVFSGGFDSLPTFEVPKLVLDAAIKACAIVGKGLYGVDIKQKGKKVYVVEVNDNPSIDHHVEDQFLGNELYMIIMNEFLDRLEKRGR